MSCNFCFNARVCSNNFDDDIILTDDNDLSFCCIGLSSDDSHRMMIRAGSGKPVTILFEKFVVGWGWTVVASYQPRYCPKCGRLLNEYDVKE